MDFPSTRQPAELNIYTQIKQTVVGRGHLHWCWVCFVETEWLLSDWLLENRMIIGEILWIMIIKLTPICGINFLLNNFEQ